MDNINKEDKSPEILRLLEKRQEIIEPGNRRLNFDSNLYRKVWVPRRLDKRGRYEVAAVDLELLFRNCGKNRWGGGYFEFNEPKASTSTERKKESAKIYRKCAEHQEK